MRTTGTRRTVAAAAAVVSLLTILTACDGARPGAGAGAEAARTSRTPSADAAEPTRIPGVGDHWHAHIPATSRQAVAVYGDGRNSPDATVVYYRKQGSTWERVRSWPAHNGKKGWTTDHHEGDNRSPVGVFTLSDAGGVREDPGAKLPYTRSPAFAAPRWWAESHWHDFDYVIAIDYNRIRGTSPNDPTRPEGRRRGGSIWVHMDHGSGTSACVSVSETAMRYLLRTLDPARHPVIVMGDRADLRRSR